MSFRWDDLGVMLALHRHGTLSGAAEALGVDASTVGRRIQALETALGGSLFARTPDGFVPTDLALRLMPHAEAAAAAADAAAAEAAGSANQATGLVRLAVADAFAVYSLAPRLHRFRAEHPGIRIEVLASPGLVDLTRREADIAVRFVKPTRGELVFRRVMAVGTYAAFCSRAYAEAHPDLSPEVVDWIGWSESRAHLPEAQLYQQVVGRPLALAADDLVVQIEAARHGAGCLLMPLEWLDANEDIVQLPSPPPIPFELPVYLVTHRALRRVPRVAAVWDWLESMLLEMHAGG